MKSINSFIIEKLKVTTRDHGATVADFICWYFSWEDISEFTFEAFEMVDFDPEVLDQYFNGNMKAQYEYIMKHINDRIGKITITNVSGDFEHKFVIGNVPFIIICDEEFPQENY